MHRIQVLHVIQVGLLIIIRDDTMLSADYIMEVELCVAMQSCV